MTVKLEIKIQEEPLQILGCKLMATLVNTDEIIAGYGDTPYAALRDLIKALWERIYFRGA